MAAESKSQLPQPESALFSPTPPREPGQRRPVVIFVLAAVFIGVVIGLWFLGTHGREGAQRNGPPPYAAQLALSNQKLSQAQNFVGATVTYLDGTVTNNGDKTLAAATVEVIFQNSLNEVVQDDAQPLRILSRSGPYPQPIDLELAPLAPHQTKEFRLTFEHISADWNQQLPAIKFVDVATR